MNITKEELYRLIDALPEKEVDTAKRFLEFLIIQESSVYSLISAPYDDEPVSKEEDKESENAWNEYLQGESISNKDAEQEISEE